MTTYTDQDELEKIKSWWKTYGNSLVSGVVIGAAILIGHKYWKSYQERQLHEASTIYTEILQGMQKTQPDAARPLVERLMKDYDSTPYAPLASLMLASAAHRRGDLAETEKLLQWSIDHGDDPARHVARLRLARLKASSGKIEDALKLAKPPGDGGGFSAEYLELQGDLLVTLNRRDQARVAYLAATKALSAGSAHGQILAMKLHDLGPEK